MSYVLPILWMAAGLCGWYIHLKPCLSDFPSVWRSESLWGKLVFTVSMLACVIGSLAAGPLCLAYALRGGAAAGHLVAVLLFCVGQSFEIELRGYAMLFVALSLLTLFGLWAWQYLSSLL
jgi:hypothetical protein